MRIMRQTSTILLTSLFVTTSLIIFVFRKSTDGGNKNTYMPGLQNITWTRYHPYSPPVIPHIIHQKWNNKKVFHKFVPWMKTWIKNHPNWKYWFWTDNSTKHFINTSYPEYYDIYTSYKDAFKKSDFFRYFALYKYGGLYVDLDMVSLKPFDNLTYSYHGIFSKFSVIYDAFAPNPEMLANGVMAVRPGHPFFLKLMDNLREKSKLPVMAATGPCYIKAIYNKYINTSAVENVTILHSKFLIPTYEDVFRQRLKPMCIKDKLKTLKASYQRACEAYLTEPNKPSDAAYATHQWVDLSEKKHVQHPKEGTTVDIHDIVPRNMLFLPPES